MNDLDEAIKEPSQDIRRSYALIMPARNEESHIRATLESVIRQTHAPSSLVIGLNDCTDRTEHIILEIIHDHPWISIIKHDFNNSRNYANKAIVFRQAFERISHLRLNYIGNLDADVILPPDYYAKVLDRLEADPRLGIAGGVFYETDQGKELKHFEDYLQSVSGMVQLFRIECYLDISGYRPISTGGVDMAAEFAARYRGWRTQSFQEIRFRHQRALGIAESNLTRAKFNEGVRDYYMGYGSLFHTLKCMRRITEPPFVMGAAARIIGYTISALQGGNKALDDNELEFLLAEQRKRMLDKCITLLPRSIQQQIREWSHRYIGIGSDS